MEWEFKQTKIIHKMTTRNLSYLFIKKKLMNLNLIGTKIYLVN